MAYDKAVDSALLDQCLTAEADAIRLKTGGADEIAFDYSGGNGFAAAIAAIPSGGGGVEDVEEGVRFITHDGRLIAAWETSEVAGKTTLPQLPLPETVTWGSGSFTLTAVEWNWTLTQVQSYMAAHPHCRLNVGCTVETPDKGAYVCIRVPEGRLALASYFTVSTGTFTIDWGDGTTPTAAASNSDNLHTYAAPGDYVVHLIPGSATSSANIFGTNTASHMIRKQGTDMIAYANMIRRLYLGSLTKMGGYAVSNCMNLEDVSMPYNLTASNTYMIANSRGMKAIVVPKGMTSIGNYFASSNYTLEDVSLPGGLTTVNQNAFQNCYALKEIAIPDSVASVGNSAFASAYSLQKIELPHRDTLTLGTYDFQYCPLQSMILPSGVQTLPNYMLANMTALVYLEIPASVTNLGSYTLQSSSGIGAVKFHRTTPATSNSNVWQYLQTDAKIYVPRGSLSAYTSAAGYPSSSTYTYVEYDV